MASNRLDKINELIKREVSTIVQKDLEFKNALVTISAVEITEDLYEGKVFVSVLGGNVGSVLEKLRKYKGAIHSQLNKRISLRRIPILTFLEDSSAEKGNEVLQLLEKVDKLPKAPLEDEK